MNKHNKILEAIKEKFPRHDHRIDQLYGEDEDFRVLCNDYLTCIEALDKYKHLSIEQRQNFKDYKNIIKELEKKLSEFIGL